MFTQSSIPLLSLITSIESGISGKLFHFPLQWCNCPICAYDTFVAWTALLSDRDLDETIMCQIFPPVEKKLINVGYWLYCFELPGSFWHQSLIAQCRVYSRGDTDSVMLIVVLIGQKPLMLVIIQSGALSPSLARQRWSPAQLSQIKGSVFVAGCSGRDRTQWVSIKPFDLLKDVTFETTKCEKQLGVRYKFLFGNWANALTGC